MGVEPAYDSRAFGNGMTAGPFTSSRFQSLCRLAAYTILFEYALYMLLGLLPFNLDPGRLLGLVGSSLETASLAVLALPLLFAGFSRDVKPARWEWHFARLLRGLLLVVAILYLLLIPATLAIGARIQSGGDQQLRQQQQLALQQLQTYRQQLSKASSSPELRRLLLAQPQLRATLAGPESPLAPTKPTLPQQRSQALRLADRIAVNLNQQALLQRSNASGELNKQQLRLVLLALVHALFFGLASMIWPSRLPAMALPTAMDDDG